MSQNKRLLLLVFVISVLIAFYELWDEKGKVLNSESLRLALEVVKNDTRIKADLGDTINIGQVIKGTLGDLKADSLIWYKIELSTSKASTFVCIRLDKGNGLRTVPNYKILKSENIDPYIFCFVPDDLELEIGIY